MNMSSVPLEFELKLLLIPISGIYQKAFRALQTEASGSPTTL